MSETGKAAMVVPFEADLKTRPWRYDWFNLMRWLDAHNPQYPRFGTAVRPGDETIRIGQKPSLTFAPATVSRFDVDEHGRTRLEQLSFGLYGPNGPMPLHLTELVRIRTEHEQDGAQRAFSDIFHHRFAMLFYRAWASAQSTVSLDRADGDRFTEYVASLIGYGEPSLRGRDAVPDHAKFFAAGHLTRTTRNPEGLTSILTAYFRCAFRIEEWVWQWLPLAPEDQTVLGRESVTASLGKGAICGASVPDRQHRFRLHAGPMGLRDYESFLPGAARHDQLRDWVRNYVGYEFAWDVRLILRRDEVPEIRLGGTARLGWTSWLGSRQTDEDWGDFVLDCERARRKPAVETIT